MNSSTGSELLAEVRKYLSSATVADIQRDMASSDFDAYHGIGDPVTEESLACLEAPVAFSTQLVLSKVIAPKVHVSIHLFETSQSHTELVLCAYEQGNYEGMPLAS